ncbi:DnaJ domain-containing protein [Carex littledalei]|uniref:DnaJ domain-containing protein n=1 Tax=Carex littledalei TaxID=544730 RepID=A0A833RBH9_9POAL|nr:DnaJ domain-containing protein [Carex littledalei]
MHDERDQKPSKSYMKYVGRQNRAERKKALKNYLHHGKASPLIFEDEDMNSTNNSSDILRFMSFGKSRPHNSSQSQKDPNSGRKTWQNRERFSGFRKEEEHEFWNHVHEEIFETLCGGSRSFTRSSSSWENFFSSSFRNSTYSSRFTGKSRRTRTKEREYFGESNGHGSDSNFNPFVGSSANRAALELPTSGPLKLEDVKIAFRAAALKWHPDRHAGPSQATAAEKFKLCVNAYQSLCSDLRAS